MPIDDTWAFVHIGNPFPPNPVRVMREQNMYVALWYKHGMPICGRAWNNGGVVECSFPWSGKELTGAKHLGGPEIQILTYTGDFETNGYYYEWVRFPERNQPHLQLVRCGNSAPCLIRAENGKRLLGNMKLDTETVSISWNKEVEIYFGKKIEETWVICRNYTAPWKLNFGQVTWIDVNEKDPFPKDEIFTTEKPLELDDGELVRQSVALWFKEGEAVLGRCWNEKGFLAASFGWNGKQYSDNIGSFQVIRYTNAAEMGYELSWRPRKDAVSKRLNPVKVRNLAPCIIRTVEGKEMLGETDMNRYKASVGHDKKEEVFVGPKVKKFLVLCRYSDAGVKDEPEETDSESQTETENVSETEEDSQSQETEEESETRETDEESEPEETEQESQSLETEESQPHETKEVSEPQETEEPQEMEEESTPQGTDEESPPQETEEESPPQETEEESLPQETEEPQEMEEESPPQETEEESPPQEKEEESLPQETEEPQEMEEESPPQETEEESLPQETEEPQEMEEESPPQETEEESPPQEKEEESLPQETEEPQEMEEESPPQETEEESLPQETEEPQEMEEESPPQETEEESPPQETEEESRPQETEEESQPQETEEESQPQEAEGSEPQETDEESQPQEAEESEPQEYAHLEVQAILDVVEETESETDVLLDRTLTEENQPQSDETQTHTPSTEETEAATEAHESTMECESKASRIAAPEAVDKEPEDRADEFETGTQLEESETEEVLATSTEQMESDTLVSSATPEDSQFQELDNEVTPDDGEDTNETRPHTECKVPGVEEVFQCDCVYVSLLVLCAIVLFRIFFCFSE